MVGERGENQFEAIFNLDYKINHKPMKNLLLNPNLMYYESSLEFRLGVYTNPS